MVAAGGKVRVMMSVEEREREEKAEKPEEKPSLNGRGLAMEIGHLGQGRTSGCLVPD
jgi:hypothetical protein